jgi:hypothetical protein
MAKEAVLEECVTSTLACVDFVQNSSVVKLMRVRVRVRVSVDVRVRVFWARRSGTAFAGTTPQPW